MFRHKPGKRLLCCILTAFCLCACSGDKSGSYNRAMEVFATGDYAAAAEAFDRLGDYQDAASYAAYAHGLTLFEMGLYLDAEPYFANARALLMGEARYQYCHAYGLEAEGRFAEAAEGFLALADFEDAAVHYRYCNARAAEMAQDYLTALYDYEEAGSYGDAESRLDNLRVQMYDRAVLLKSQGQYEQALNLFGKLGDYFDSPAQARECKQFFREERYNQAEALLAEGDLEGAYNVFKGLSGYSDSETRAGEIGLMLGIDPPTVE